jgi:kynurenine formamidase
LRFGPFAVRANEDRSMSRERWGHWGEADERGTLNLIQPDQVRAAAGLVRSGVIFSLAQPISARMPIPQHRAPPGHFMMRTGGDYAAGARRPGGFQFAEDTLFLPLHLGTHIDSLCHVWYDDQLYNGHAQTGIRSGGAERCGVDKLPPIVTRGVLLDLVAASGGPLPDGRVVGVDEVKRAIAATGVTLGRGDAVLLRTGWLEAHQNVPPDFNAEPGLNLEAAIWLAECGVALIGADNYAIEVMPFANGAVFPVHQRLIRDYGMPLLEGLVLQPLAEAASGAFLFMAAPLRIEGGTASPLTPLAIL